MRIETIRRMIGAAIDHEQQTGHIVDLLQRFSSKRKTPYSVEITHTLRDYCITYVKLVPEYLEEGCKQASKLGIKAEMNFMLNELESYWFLQTDLIPDKLGLIGIMDDAYASLFLLQSLSTYCADRWGHALLTEDLTLINTVARNFLGDKIAVTLERTVRENIRANMADNKLQHLISTIFSSGLAFQNTLSSLRAQQAIRYQGQIKLDTIGIC